MEILIAVVVILSIAVLAGVLLSVFSHFFSTPENPLKKEIRQCLPGINCGACGFKGCDDYTEALACGNAAPNLCIPGAQAVADEISKIIGVEAEPFEDVVAFVACNGHCDAVVHKAKYEGLNTCKAASMVYGGENACRVSCLGFGDCANACPADAICLRDGIAHVNTDRCLGCGVCAVTCPKQIIHMLPQKTAVAVMCSNKDKGADARKACKNACIGCKKCERVCQHGAIIVNNNLAVIDYDKCTNCGNCATECPTGCLKKVFFPDLPQGVGYEELIG